MEFIHSREYLNAGDVVQLDCDTQCNFMLTDDSNFSAYKHGGQVRYFGGHFKSFPARIIAPSTGYWNISIDLAGGSATIRHSLKIIRA